MEQLRGARGADADVANEVAVRCPRRHSEHQSIRIVLQADIVGRSLPRQDQALGGRIPNRSSIPCRRVAKHLQRGPCDDILRSADATVRLNRACGSRSRVGRVI